MRALAVAVSIGLLPLLSACVVYSSSQGETVTVSTLAPDLAVTETLEPLSRISFDGQTMTVVVGSNGCTQASSFDVYITDSETAEISLVRREPDLCRAILAEGVSLSWSYEELGLKAGMPVKLLNPLST